MGDPFGCGGAPPAGPWPIRRSRIRRGRGRHLEAAERELNPPGIGGPDALIDGERPAQAGDGGAGLVVTEVAGTKSFRGAGFLQWCAAPAGDGERLRMVPAGLAGGGGVPRQLSDSACPGQYPNRMYRPSASW